MVIKNVFFILINYNNQNEPFSFKTHFYGLSVINPGKGRWLSHIQNTGRWNYSALADGILSIYWVSMSYSASLPCK